MNQDYGGYISKIIFNTNEMVDLKNEDIVVFVGPNNSGKSQCLRDIYNSSLKLDEGLVIKKIDLNLSTVDDGELLKKICNIDGYGNYSYKGIHIESKTRGNYFGNKRDVYISFLKTEERLTYCNPCINIDKGDIVTHPMQSLVENAEMKKELSELFFRAFHERLYLYTRGKNISLRIGKIEEFTSINSKTEVVEEYYSEISNLPHIKDQGDGMRSFVSILLSLIIDYKRIYLMDEPESFLHQPQARILGRLICDKLKPNQQAFISTHSTDLIKGLLENGNDRIKIVRVTRNGDTNSFNVLSNDDLKNISNDELLKHTNILDGLFSDKVIVCESDIDCLLYSSIEENIMRKAGNYSDTLFIYTGGKTAFPKTIRSLFGLGVDYRAIFDIDVLNDEGTISKTYNICGGNWNEEIGEKYSELLLWLKENGSNVITKEEAKSELINAIDRCSNNVLSTQDIKNIKSSIKKSSLDGFKEKGIDYITNPDVRKTLDYIFEKLQEKHIYLVPYGEIESFVPEIDGHSHGWLEKLFSTYESLDDSVYDKIKNFVRKVIE